MGKIYFHSGDLGAVKQPTEVIGSIADTGAQLSALGRSLRPNIDGSDRHVFSNCNHVLNGFRISVGHGDVKADDVVLVHHADGIELNPKILQDGRLDHWPKGYFDQFLIDSAALVRIKGDAAKEQQKEAERLASIQPQPETDQMDHEEIAKAAGFELKLTNCGRYTWISNDSKEGQERHSTQNEAWEECVETNKLSNPAA